MDWSLACTKAGNEVRPTPAKAHWSTLWSTGHLLDAAAEEWRPSIHLMRTVTSALGWEETCVALGRELVAMTGARQVTLYIAADFESELQALPLVGEPLPIIRPPSPVRAISVDEGAVTIRLSVKPASFLLISKPMAEQAIKPLSVLAPDLGELLAARFQLSNDDSTGQAESRGPSPLGDGIGSRRQLGAMADKWERVAQQLAHMKAMELKAWREHSKAALDAAWLQHDLQLEALRELSRERREAWCELLEELTLRINCWLKGAEKCVPEWAEQGRQETDVILARVTAIEALLAELGTP